MSEVDLTSGLIGLVLRHVVTSRSEGEDLVVRFEVGSVFPSSVQDEGGTSVGTVVLGDL